MKDYVEDKCLAHFAVTNACESNIPIAPGAKFIFTDPTSSEILSDGFSLDNSYIIVFEKDGWPTIVNNELQGGGIIATGHGIVNYSGFCDDAVCVGEWYYCTDDSGNGNYNGRPNTAPMPLPWTSINPRMTETETDVKMVRNLRLIKYDPTKTKNIHPYDVWSFKSDNQGWVRLISGRYPNYFMECSGGDLFGSVCSVGDDTTTDWAWWKIETYANRTSCPHLPRCYDFWLSQYNVNPPQYWPYNWNTRNAAAAIAECPS